MEYHQQLFMPETQTSYTIAQPTILRLDALRNSNLRDTPFPFLVIENFLNEHYLEEILKDFPEINFRGSFPLNELKYGGAFENLIEELEGDAFRSAIEEKFDCNLGNCPTMITARGVTTDFDGQIHTDAKWKVITVLLYFNSAWESQEGRLRILNDRDNLEDFAVEIPPTAGTCLIFKVTDNCWHGHKPFVGKRKAIQLNYVKDETTLKKQMFVHNLSFKFKNLKKRFLKGKN